MRNDFSLYFRKVPSGKRVFYYYAYDDDRSRQGPWSTGQKTKTAARNYCYKLIREGRLLPNNKEILTFSEFATDFWDWENSPNLKEPKEKVLVSHDEFKAMFVSDWT
jgi:hypothetical protein